MDRVTTHLARGATLASHAGVFDEARGFYPGAVDPEIGAASLVYDERGAAELARTYRDAMLESADRGLPFLALTESRWANAERVGRSRFWERPVNGDLVRLVRDVAASLPPATRTSVLVAGAVGPRASAYGREPALAREDARAFHSLQVEALASAGVDCLVGLWLPALPEALGLADVLARTELPFLLHFVLGANDRLLDGTPLAQAIASIDDEAPRAPVVFFASREPATSPKAAAPDGPWCLHRRESCWLHVGTSRRASVTKPR